jgi:hypothetical protein
MSQDRLGCKTKRIHLRWIVADDDLSAPDLHGEAPSRRRSRPPPGYDHAIGAGDQWWTPWAHPRPGKAMLVAEALAAQKPHLGTQQACNRSRGHR